MAADLMTQTVAEKKSFDEIDWRAQWHISSSLALSISVAFNGGSWSTSTASGSPQWTALPRLPFADKIKDTAGILDAAKMVVFDLCVHLPIMYFPTYYTVKEFVGGHSWNPIDWVRDGMEKYRKNMKEDLTAMVQLVGTFRLCPVCPATSHSNAISSLCQFLLDGIRQFHAWCDRRR